jgi:type II secretory pathway component GspD/PulD (secretin)
LRTALLAQLIISLFLILNVQSALAQQPGENLINNIFLDTDLRQALQDIAVQSGATIIPGPDVTGMVTAELKDKTVEKALDIVLASTDYEWIKQDGYYLVYSPIPDSPVFSRVSRTKIVQLKYVRTGQVLDLLPPNYKMFVTSDPVSGTVMVTATRKMLPRILSAIRGIDVPARSAQPDVNSLEFIKQSRIRLIKLNFAKAEEVAELIPTMYKKYVTVGKSTNLILVTAYPDIVDKVADFIVTLDQPAKHVLLDARVVVLDRNDLLNLGIEWGFPTVQAGIRWDDGLKTDAIQIGLTTGLEFTNALNAALNLLQTNREATIISKPQVVAQDGHEATIKVTTEEYFKIITDITGFERAQLEKIETGTILVITPRIAEDGTINISLSAEVSDVIARTGPDDLPVINRRIVTSTVRIKNGGTIAIAGLMNAKTNDSRNFVPGLSKVPVLGELFKNTDTQETTQQVAIFVTATILPDKPEDIAQPKKKPIPMVDRELFREQLKTSYQELVK